MIPRNKPLPHLYYLAERSRSVLKGIGIGINRTEPPKFGSAGSISARSRWKAWVTATNTTLSHMCYNITLGCSALKGVSISR